MGLQQPWSLAALLALPALAVVVRVLGRRRARQAIAFTNLELLAALPARRLRRRLVVPTLSALALAAAAVAMARPYLAHAAVRARGTVVLVVDSSGSMRATDIRPSRLGAAQAAVRAFLARTPAGLRIGLVALDAQPGVVLAPSADHRVVEQAVERLSPGGGTAIGDALVAAVSLGEQTETGNSAQRRLAANSTGGRFRRLVSILLLSDGAQTNGLLTPLAGAERAARDGIRVDTLALGTPSGRLNIGGTILPAPPDPATLATIARSTGGHFTNATTGTILRDAYTQLATRFARPASRDQFGYALLTAAAALLTAALAASILTTRLP